MLSSALLFPIFSSVPQLRNVIIATIAAKLAAKEVPVAVGEPYGLFPPLPVGAGAGVGVGLGALGGVGVGGGDGDGDGPTVFGGVGFGGFGFLGATGATTLAVSSAAKVVCYCFF